MKQTPLGLLMLIGLSANTYALDYGAQIDPIFNDIKATTPGCNVGVIQNGKWVHKAGYGLANMELNVPLDGNQVHRIASVSKQFTAMAVQLLADEGKIDLNHDIHRYLPELRDYGHTVTINAMLGHVAGMGDYDFVDELKDDKAVQLKSTMGGKFRLGNEDYLTINEFYDYVKTVPLRHPPEQKWAYSNYAYFLLSILVERVSGQSLRDYAAQHIFEPLNMKHTFFSDKPTEIVKNRASGYSKDEKGEYVTSMTNLFWVGDGGVHTNLEDMLKWDNYFYKPTLGKNPAALLARFISPNHGVQHEKFDYANGQMIAKKDDLTVFAHSGGWLGTVTYYERIPQKQLSTVVFCNDESLDAPAYGKAIRKKLLAQ
jgi:CubicO group peptidase (beta-lactamase class C family)